MTGVRKRLALAAVLGAATTMLGTVVPAEAAPAVNGMRNVAPVRPANQDMTRPGQFVLNGDSDVELVRLVAAHDVEVCLPNQMNVSGRPELQGDERYRLIVASENETREIRPGDCTTFDTAKLRVGPTSELPKGAHVVGDVHVY